MNIRLGIYEIFSRIIPGGFYIAAIGQLLAILGLVKIDWQTINEISFSTSIGLIVIAYILGGALDNFALILYRLFKKPGYSARSFAEFKQKNKDRWIIDFENGDWPVLLAFIRTKNLELSGEIDRHNALSIMLRNVGLGILLMVINNLIQFFTSWNPIFILISALLLVVSILIIREAVKFRGWFYNNIFETIIAYRLDLEKRVIPIDAKKKTKDHK